MKRATLLLLALLSISVWAKEIKIVVIPSNAVIKVNGSYYGEGNAILKISKNDFASVEFTCPGYETLNTRIYGSDKRKTIEVKLKEDTWAKVTSQSGVAPAQGFTMKCKALVKKIDNKKTFGIVLDYKDNWNCTLIQVKEDIAELYTVEKGRVTGYMRNQFKLGKLKKAELDFLIKYIDGTLELRVNDVMALKKKYVEFTSNGIGFFAYGKVEVDFDDLEVY